MATGLDPGSLGLYGFRHRKGYSYDEMWIANSKAVREKKLRGYIGEAGGPRTPVCVPPRAVGERTRARTGMRARP